MSKNETVLVLDFGSQYSQLIARRVRECGVYCEIIPYNYTLDKIKAKNPKAIILSGGPNSVYAENTPSVDEGIFEMGIPVLELINHPREISELVKKKANRQVEALGVEFLNVQIEGTSLPD